MVEDALTEVPPGMALAIVHGVGSGQLRAAVHKVLREHPQVTYWRLSPTLITSIARLLTVH